VSDSRAPPDPDEDLDETDAEEVESEWFVWVFATLVVAGIALLFAPQDLAPRLLAGLAPVFVILGVTGWAFQWYVGREN